MLTSGSPEDDLCEVYLCKTPMMFIDFLGRLFTLKPWVCGFGNSWYKHWTVAFDYSDDVVLICEGGVDHANLLTGRRFWKKKDMFNKFYRNKTFLGKHTVPKVRIETLLKQMCDCGPYDAIRNNCHKWAICFIDELGIPPPEENQAEEVVKKAILPGMSIIFSAVGVIGLVCIFARPNIS